jgi:hypothetical protein
MSFLGVYKALYAYVPQNAEELAIEENDILYLMEKSDVDDWWTVKKRVVGSDVEEPVGLVPSNYIEPADTIGTATALYDYDRQTEEEISFKEGEQFQVYDDKDPDWILVSKDQECGFVPANYIEVGNGSATTSAPQQQQQSQPQSFLPPPAHPSLATSTVTATPALQPPPQRYDAQHKRELDSEDEARPVLPSKPRPESTDYSRHDDSYDADAPPPKPTRPTEQREISYSTRNGNDDDDQLYTWSVSEVDGRKKKKAMLAIGNGTIYFSPDSVNGGSPQQWKAKDLLSFSSEKKHLFLEFKDPMYSLELHSGTKEVAAEILTVLGEMKGSVSQKGLKEIKAAASSKSSSNKKTGRILYSFEAEGADELTVREGDVVSIVNNTKSKDWWLVQNITTGKAGVVPAQFVDPVQEEKQKSSLSSKFRLSRSKSKDNLRKGKQQDGQESPKKLSQPKSSRIRTWEDRSGSFKVDAEFLGVVEGKIHLHKTNGVKIAVDAPKLSLADLEYVERVTGMSLEAYKSKRGSSKPGAEDDRERRARKERERKRRERDEQERERIQYERERLERLSEREKLERERDRKERELERREREMDREERDRLRYELDEAKRKLAEMPPAKPARPDPIPQVEPSRPASARSTTGPKKEEYDWFEFFLEAGVDVNQCQRYSNNFSNEQIDPSILESIDATVLRTLGLREGDIIRVTKYIDQKFNRQPKTAESTGALFTDSTGALKVSRTSPANQVTESLPSPTKTNVQPQSGDDDAWTVKPAANSESVTAQLQTQQFTGSMQDLVNLKPLEPTKTSSSAKSYAPVPSKPLEPIKTGASMAPALTGGITAQPTGIPLDPFKTGGGNLLPLATGGFVYLPIQQTGIIGLMPLQKTGGMNPALTGGFMPLQKTGGLSAALTGGLIPLQKTGGLNSGLTGGLMPLQKTSTIPQTSFGAVPQTSFGAIPPTSFGQPLLTGGLNPIGTGFISVPQLTGGFPQTSFGVQPNIGFPQTSFGGQPTGGFPQSTFGTQASGFQQQLSTGANPTGYSLSSPPTFNNQAPMYGQGMNTLTHSFQSTSISTPFPQHQPMGMYGQSQTSFGQAPQPSFGFGQQQPQPTFGFGQQPQSQQMPQATFGGFGQQQPLEAQPTGFGFGNTPSHGGQKADLTRASADNPFGF